MTIDSKHNQDALQILLSDLEDLNDELFGWQDGTKVENDSGLEVVEHLVGEIKSFEKRAKAAKENEFRPHKIAADGVVARWSEILKTLAGHRAGLLATVTDFKNQKAREQKERERAAWQAAFEAERIAKAAAAEVDMKNAAERQAADDAALQASQARDAVQEIKAEAIKGLRTKKTVHIDDVDLFFGWLLSFRKEAIDDFLQAEAEKAVRGSGGATIAGVSVTIEKVAF